MSLYKGEQLIAGVAESVGNIDNVTITQNTSNEIQTVAVKNQNATANNAIKTWTGTQAEYDAITTKDPTTLYNVTDTDPSYSVNTQYKNIGAIVQSMVPLTDAGLHLLDGSLIQMGVYSEFVEYMANLYGDGTNIPSYFCSESDWQTAVTTYGVCGKFVYDSVNNTVRLPKVTGIIEGTTDITALGDLIEAGLPNITGQANKYVGYGNGSGAIYITSGQEGLASPGSSYGTQVLNLDASRSSSIYGNSSTVQPQTIKAFYYIVIANSTKTEIQSDIDEIATDLNGKADVDLSNINASQNAKNEIIGWGMPDYANKVSFSDNTKIQVPVDALVSVGNSGNGGTGWYGVDLWIYDTDGTTEIWYSGNTATYASSVNVYVPKGLYVKAMIYGSNQYRQFIPLKGAN